MGYHQNANQIQKISDLIDKKIREITFITFNKIFSKKISEKLLTFFTNNFNQDNFDQKLNTKPNTNFNFNSLEFVM